MESKKQTQFADGLSIYAPHQNAPDFIKGDVVITEDFLDFFKNNSFKNAKGVKQLRLNLMHSKKGTYYFAVNDYRPQPKDQEQINQISVNDAEIENDLPF